MLPSNSTDYLWFNVIRKVRVMLLVGISLPGSTFSVPLKNQDTWKICIIERILVKRESLRFPLVNSLVVYLWLLLLEVRISEKHCHNYNPLDGDNCYNELLQCNTNE